MEYTNTYESTGKLPCRTCEKPTYNRQNYFSDGDMESGPFSGTHVICMDCLIDARNESDAMDDNYPFPVRGNWHGGSSYSPDSRLEEWPTLGDAKAALVGRYTPNGQRRVDFTYVCVDHPRDENCPTSTESVYVPCVDLSSHIDLMDDDGENINGRILLTENGDGDVVAYMDGES